MIEVVERKGVPVYETECYECKSKFRFTRSETWSGMFNHINCPVCGAHNCFELKEGSHVALMDSNSELPKGCVSCENKCRMFQSRVLASQNPVPMTYLQENRLAGCPLEGEE